MKYLLVQQLDLYNNIFRVLKPGGMFINLGFLFDDVEERDQFRELHVSRTVSLVWIVP